jgi:voltage-gated potassium channel
MKVHVPGLKTFIFGRYGNLLLVLLVLLLLQPTIHTVLGKYLLEALFVAALFAGLRAIEINKGLLRFEVVLLLFSLVLGITGFLLGSAALFFWGIAGRALFMSLIALTILLDLFRAREVSGDTLAGAVCVYLMIAFISAYCFLLIEFVMPGSFSFTQGAARLQLWVAHELYPFFYFSMVTMTTVGYGDMTPVTTVARTFATLEALTGQVYLTILVARLVGMHLVQQGRVESNDLQEG